MEVFSKTDVSIHILINILTMKFENLPIDEESDRFKIHLSQENNIRILFSGIFGIGKTYFIKKFFESEIDYIPITLNPVNYSVNQNEDIFELVKFDIAFQLLAKNPTFEKIEFNKYFAGQYFILENYKSILGNIIENASKIDHSINQIIESSLKLGKQIEQFHAESKIDDEKVIHEFLDFFKEQKGTIKEENNITHLLSALINSLKTEEKKVVLVIDDMDRIDPEHIFRILNVFSAHFDYYDFEGENKFGFDKIILICDIENIRGIFHNKYGANIDFSGYVDKFYSNEIFYYKIENVINRNLKHFLSAIRSNNRTFSEQVTSNDSFIKNGLLCILTFFVECKTISLRKLLSFLNNEIEFPSYTIIVRRNNLHKNHSNSTPILFVLETLERMFGNKSQLTAAIDKVIDKYSSISLERYGNYTDSIIGNLAMIADYTESHLFPSSDRTYFYNIEGTTIEYKIENYNHSYGVYGYAVKISPTKSNGDPTETINNYILPFFQLFKAAYIAKSEIVKDFS